MSSPAPRTSLHAVLAAFAAPVLAAAAFVACGGDDPSDVSADAGAADVGAQDEDAGETSDGPDASESDADVDAASDAGLDCGPNGEAHGDHCHCAPGFREGDGGCEEEADGGGDAGDAGAVCGGHGHLHGATCHCDAGYVASGDTCVPAPVADAGAPLELRYGISRVGFDDTLATYARSLNASRQVTGNGNAPGVTGLRAYAWDPTPAPAGTITNLGVLPGSNDFSRGYAINAAGVVVGESDNNTSRAFRWEAGVMTDLGTLGGASAVATSINDDGVIVGASSNGATSRAFKYVAGTMSALPSLDGSTTTPSRATSINAAGDVVGYSRNASGVTRGTMWRADGTIVNLGYLVAGSLSWAFDVNAHRTVVGSAVVGVTPSNSSIYHPFLWDDGAMRDLGTLGGFTHAEAMAINDDGWVVGYSGNFYNSPTTGAAAAVLWVGDEIYDLNVVLPANSGWTLLAAMDINAHGDIVGYGRKDGVIASFLLTREP
ncbi:MAG: hypothetical protein KIS78_01930 [Labilithrix sp.]|nr:hypothetical protein [Labilithrix sp.]MCW5831199.1 hypothetical protein [Labilithrix sp.]